MSVAIKLPNNSKSVVVMGIINLSQDSFYDKSRCSTEDETLRMAERMIEEGADILDIGAESSRPGSKPIAAEVELERLLPVIAACEKRFAVPLSVDTCKPAVAARVLTAGASMINDITGLQRHQEMAATIARHSAAVIVMHMQGTPATMQIAPDYGDLLGEIGGFLKTSIEIAEKAGIDPEKIVVDPGIGFGKTVEHNLQIVRQLDRLKKLNKPILIGVSRKSFVGKILDLPIEERLEGSIAASVVGMMNGARIFRTHDVRATHRAIKMARAILNAN